MLTSSGAGRVHPSARTSPISTYPEPAKNSAKTSHGTQSVQSDHRKNPQRKLCQNQSWDPVPGSSVLVADDIISRRVYIRRARLAGGRIRWGNHSNRRLVLFFITPSLALMAATATANSQLFFVADITFSLRTDLLQEGSAIPNHSGLTSSLPCLY